MREPSCRDMLHCPAPLVDSRSLENQEGIAAELMVDRVVMDI